MVTINNLATEQQWSLESLNKAYQKGYMAGLTSHALNLQACAFEVLQAAWEAGWHDGQEQALLLPHARIA